MNALGWTVSKRSATVKYRG